MNGVEGLCLSVVLKTLLRYRSLSIPLIYTFFYDKAKGAALKRKTLNHKKKFIQQF